MRWENYFIKSDRDFTSFWETYTQEKRDILYIMGIGFDPRSVVSIQQVLANQQKGLTDVVVFRYYQNEEEIEKPNDPMVDNNLQILTAFLSNKRFNAFKQRPILLRSEKGESITAISASKYPESIDDINAYTDVVVDISAMPRSIFLPLLKKLLSLIVSYNDGNCGHSVKNLHVVVAENAILDAKITDRGIDEEAEYIHGFRIGNIDKTSQQKQVWIPLLGENQTEQFAKIRKKLSPVETCPVLPFPSEGLRRGDQLINTYGELLFNDSDFETKNIVYANESNPFQVYRLLTKTIERYSRSFDILGGCKIVVSALSSKLLTIGAFLAVWEQKHEGKNIGIMHVESIAHKLDSDYQHIKEQVENNHKMFEIWLAGEPYLTSKHE